MYDEERDCEYTPLTCMNDDNYANRIRAEGANPCIFVVSASQKLNSDIAKDFHRVLSENKIDLLVTFEIASEEILQNIKDYVSSPTAEMQIFFETPFLETQEFISEATSLTYEKKEQTGVIVVKETNGNRKDRYTSISYGSYFASLLEQDMALQSEEYDFAVFIN